MTHEPLQEINLEPIQEVTIVPLEPCPSVPPDTPLVDPPASKPLQTYQRRPRPSVVPIPEAVEDSPPTPSPSPDPVPQPEPSLPPVIRKGEALSHPEWRQAMIDEMCALQSSGTWELVPLPPGKSLVGCRWIYTVKVGPDGKIDRFKARLVAKGYTQIFGHSALASPSA
ncbi:receptor-like protein kinase [Trifolium pratense]|uniref:Receptor-like protein kinase n=1 Tax=Trifolium pratense TaxID=57577 RepID=A0A2K3KH95_TRIPR|nr:receptor-like protein kinase [Trifolium pratense]